MKLRLFLLCLITAASLRAADGLPQFNALMTMGKDHRFVLVSEAGKASPWLRVGAVFEGYTIKGYDTASGGLDLERDGKVTRVMIMSDAATQSSGPASLPSTPATLAEAEEVLRVMHFDEMMSKILDQQKKAISGNMQKMSAQMKMPEEDRERFLKLQQKIIDETMESAMGPELKGEVAKIYSEVFSREELAAQGAFYSTPAGQSMVAKQPQVQEKMMQVMMPKMAQLAPKIQQMARDFAAEMKAKQTAPAPAPAPGTP
ncbi:MAG: DUF2059 domain-containing protein [Verrucomicrobia bacterium]|nr:DUF2059 domain-containing protein [Verrucomicrobiota bacterium]